MIKKISIVIPLLILVISCCPKQEKILTQFRSEDVRLAYEKAVTTFDSELGYADGAYDSVPDISKYVAMLDSAIALDPTDAAMKLKKAFWDQVKKDFRNECDVYLDVYQMYKSDARDLLMYMGICQDNLGNRDSADYYYHKYIEEEEKIIRKMGDASLKQAMNLATTQYLLTEDEEKAREMFYCYVDSTAVKNTDKYFNGQMRVYLAFPELNFPNGRAKRNTN